MKLVAKVDFSLTHIVNYTVSTEIFLFFLDFNIIAHASINSPCLYICLIMCVCDDFHTSWQHQPPLAG